MTVRESIIRVYSSLDSIKATARELGISEQTVRRVLLEAGAYTSERFEEICRLHEAGLSAGDIAKKLKVSKNTVQAYLPYVRTPYVEAEKSKNAMAIAAWREKKSAQSKKR